MWSMKDMDSVNVDDLQDEPVSSNNFEDFIGHYSLFGEGLSRKYAHQDLLRCHHLKRDFRKKIAIAP